ncbi:MAG: TRAP transporter substrate-binding protein [Synergistaceae bacterium]|nr:TRAP transporter substrate-binding protein [Synergistaceae bacterium]
MKKLLTVVLIYVLTLSGSAFAAEKVYKIKVGNVTAPDHPLNVSFEKMAELMREKSGGRLDATVFPNSQLGSLRAISEGLQMGTIEMGTQSPGGLASFMPLYGVLELPYVYSSNADVYKIVDGPITQELDEIFRKKTGIRILGYWMNLYRNTTNNKHPIAVPSDFKGLKLRVPETKTVMDTIATLGASPVPMNMGEVYTALSQGIIDGQENPLTVIWASKLYEVQKYLSLTGHIYSPACVMISDQFFEELPEDLRRIVVESVAEVRPIAREMVEKQEETLIEQLKEKGMQVNEVDTTEFRKLMEPFYKSFIESNGEEAAEYLKRIQESL